MLADADRVYAVINEKEYTVTNVPCMAPVPACEQNTLGLYRYIQLFILKMMTKIENGMYATIVIEKQLC